MANYPDYLQELMTRLSPSEFFNIVLKKLDEIEGLVRSRDELILLDQILMKASIMSKDIKMKMSSTMKKFNNSMDAMEPDKNDFLNHLKMYHGVKGPYTTGSNSNLKSIEENFFEVSRSRERAKITGSRSAQGLLHEQTQKMYQVSSAASSPVISKSAAGSYRSRGGYKMPRPRSSSIYSNKKDFLNNFKISKSAARSYRSQGGHKMSLPRSSSSSGSSDDERATLCRKLNKPLNASKNNWKDEFKEQLEKQGAYPMQKSNFSSAMKMLESSSRESEEAYGSPYATNKADVSSSGRVVRSHGFSRSGDQGYSTPGRSVGSYDTHSKRDDAYTCSRSDTAYGSRYSPFEDDSPNRSYSNFARNQGKWGDKKAYPWKFSSYKY